MRLCIFCCLNCAPATWETGAPASKGFTAGASGASEEPWVLC